MASPGSTLAVEMGPNALALLCICAPNKISFSSIGCTGAKLYKFVYTRKVYKLRYNLHKMQ